MIIDSQLQYESEAVTSPKSVCDKYMLAAYKDYMEDIRSLERMPNNIATRSVAKSKDVLSGLFQGRKKDAASTADNGLQSDGARMQPTKEMSPEATKGKNKKMANTAIITMVEKTVFVALKSSILNYSTKSSILEQDATLKFKIDVALDIVEAFELKELETYDRSQILKSVENRDLTLDAADYVMEKCYKTVDNAMAILHAFLSEHVVNSGHILDPEINDFKSSSTNYKLPDYATAYDNKNEAESAVRSQKHSLIQRYFNNEMKRKQQSAYRGLFLTINTIFRDMNQIKYEIEKIGPAFGQETLKPLQTLWKSIIGKFETVQHSNVLANVPVINKSHRTFQRRNSEQLFEANGKTQP